LISPFHSRHKGLDAVRIFFIGNPDGLLIGYLKEAVIPETAMIYWHQPPRSAEKETGL
jgi:hypothetical protein